MVRTGSAFTQWAVCGMCTPFEQRPGVIFLGAFVLSYIGLEPLITHVGERERDSITPSPRPAIPVPDARHPVRFSALIAPPLIRLTVCLIFLCSSPAVSVGTAHCLTFSLLDARSSCVLLLCAPCLLRCRMSASPATGLVGMEENVFLGDFFGCLGVLPLATEG